MTPHHPADATPRPPLALVPPTAPPPRPPGEPAPLRPPTAVLTGRPSPTRPAGEPALLRPPIAARPGRPSPTRPPGEPAPLRPLTAVLPGRPSPPRPAGEPAPLRPSAGARPGRPSPTRPAGEPAPLRPLTAVLPDGPTSRRSPDNDGAWAEGIRRVADMAARAVGEIGALVAPPGCVACGTPTGAPGERLCGACIRALPWLRPGCPRCALPSHRGRPCPASAAAYARAWAPLAYEGVARDLIGALKFRGALPVADVMAAHMAANLPAALRAGDAVVTPVPGLAARRRRRGFDPAAVLASAFARRLGRPVADCLARRDRSTRQVGAGRAARRAPGRIAVTLHRPPAAVVLLVDDVHTTGATLDACARALTAAGATVLAAVTYARTL